MPEPKAHSPKPKADPKPEARRPKPESIHTTALRMLARRELSEAQVRERLARRGYAVNDIDAAIHRLKDQRAIDDARVAEAIART
jgi:regulatory protein